ncbi:DUF4293 domain-containing protein [Halosquirtibacter laminarini]|uniref:DUF4293 domain-containing protein n=1 Tax=Halosquirtibacter laminarini TaxID=3374600 RepID=A0AC61NJF4_9BACT|nr:DUF4293 domain-containing protein [Prolixibacteraceae bacterium]
MIQRIQSLFLLVSALFMASLFFPCLAWLKGASATYEMYLTGVTPQLEISGASMIPLLSFVVLIILLSLVTIFMYKKRVIQIRMTVINMILKLGLMGVIYFYAYSVSTLIDGDFSLNHVIAFPLVSFIFDYLAIRGIGRDEALVRAADRIR